MFDIALANNPATALTVGTTSNLTFDLVQAGTPGGQSVRSVSAVALTAPHTLKIGHATRMIKGLTYSATKQKAPDIIVDRHLVRVDKALLLPTWGIYDPNFLCNYNAQLVIEVPRVGADSPTLQQVMDNVLRTLVLLNPSSNAGLSRLINGES